MKKTKHTNACEFLLKKRCICLSFGPTIPTGPRRSVDSGAPEETLHLQAPLPGSDPPVCNPSIELEHQRLASDYGVQ